MELLSIICIAGFTPTMVFNYFLDDPAVLPKSDNKWRSENMQQIYRRAPMPKCDFNKVEKQLYWNHTSAWDSPVNLLHIFRASFLKNTSEELRLDGFVLILKIFKIDTFFSNVIDSLASPNDSNSSLSVPVDNFQVSIWWKLSARVNLKNFKKFIRKHVEGSPF